MLIKLKFRFLSFPKTDILNSINIDELQGSEQLVFLFLVVPHQIDWEWHACIDINQFIETGMVVCIINILVRFVLDRVAYQPAVAFKFNSLAYFCQSNGRSRLMDQKWGTVVNLPEGEKQKILLLSASCKKNFTSETSRYDAIIEVARGRSYSIAINLVSLIERRRRFFTIFWFFYLSSCEMEFRSTFIAWTAMIWRHPSSSFVKKPSILLIAYTTPSNSRLCKSPNWCKESIRT